MFFLFYLSDKICFVSSADKNNDSTLLLVKCCQTIVIVAVEMIMTAITACWLMNVGKNACNKSSKYFCSREHLYKHTNDR